MHRGMAPVGERGDNASEPVPLPWPDVITSPATSLLERDRELGAFADALTDAEQARGRVVMVEAPAGIGKTSLLRAASEAAAPRGFLCLRARASELEHDFAYGCVRQLFDPVVARAPDAERDRLFEGAAALSKPLFDPPALLPRRPVDDTTYSMLYGLYWLLNNLTAESAVVLFVDDLHWCDTESLRFLAYLAPRLDGLRVVVVVSARPGEPGPDELAALRAGPETTVLLPGPLSLEATATMCERRLAGPVASDFAAACHEVTVGNPFLLEALLREAVDDGLGFDSLGARRVRRMAPAAVAQAVLFRLSGRPPAGTALVRSVAVLGDGTSLTEAATLAGLSSQEAARAADLLVGLAILRPSERLEFAHPIVREAVYADIGVRERAEAHAHAAEVLAASGAPEERIAAQIAEADPAADSERVALLRRVAADALTRGAPAAAVAWLRRALVEPPPPESRAEVLLELGLAELRLAAPEAVEHLAAAAELSLAPDLLETSARLLANALTMSGEADRSLEVLASAIADVEKADRERALLLEAELAAHAQQASRESRAPAARRLERLGALPGTTPGERLVLATLAFERSRAAESASVAAALIEQALSGGRLLDEQEIDVTGPFYLLIVGLEATDALDLAEACLDRALADAQARACVPAMAFVLAHRALVEMRAGAVARAESDSRTAIDLLTANGIRLGTALALGVLVEALVESGEVEAADRLLRESEFGAGIPAGLASNRLLEARSVLRLAQGRLREGIDDLHEFGRRDELWGGANPLASRWRSRAALALAAMGDHDRAHRMAMDDLERARRWGAASGIGVALRCHALLGGSARSVEPLREAVAVLEGSPARLERVRALIDLGAALRRANRRADARLVLERGLALADRCGARSLAGLARAELRAAGGRSADPDGVGVQQLTASERRVADLAAEGLSNAEIAQALFVTSKTVETHLGRVYRKLSLSGRGGLGRALAQPSLQPRPDSTA